jgi:hypothetical protein
MLMNNARVDFINGFVARFAAPIVLLPRYPSARDMTFLCDSSSFLASLV